MRKSNKREIKGCGKKPSLVDKSDHFSLRAIFLVPILVTLDFLIKVFITAKKPNFFILNFLGIEYATNTGIAFGIFKSSPFINTLLIILVLAVFIFFFWESSFGSSKKAISICNRLGLIGFILVISGGIGNLIDRILYGYVIDFIKIGFWPNFNLADSYITIGVILIIISLFLYEYNADKANKGLVSRR